jgi:hypothetical protein
MIKKKKTNYKFNYGEFMTFVRLMNELNKNTTLRYEQPIEDVEVIRERKKDKIAYRLYRHLYFSDIKEIDNINVLLDYNLFRHNELKEIAIDLIDDYDLHSRLNQLKQIKDKDSLIMGLIEIIDGLETKDEDESLIDIIDQVIAGY